MRIAPTGVRVVQTVQKAVRTVELFPFFDQSEYRKHMHFLHVRRICVHIVNIFLSYIVIFKVCVWHFQNVFGIAQRIKIAEAIINNNNRRSVIIIIAEA
jgi:hypothetical protein